MVGPLWMRRGNDQSSATTRLMSATRTETQLKWESAFKTIGGSQHVRYLRRSLIRLPPAGPSPKPEVGMGTPHTPRSSRCADGALIPLNALAAYTSVYAPVCQMATASPTSRSWDSSTPNMMVSWLSQLGPVRCVVRVLSWPRESVTG